MMEGQSQRRWGHVMWQFFSIYLLLSIYESLPPFLLFPSPLLQIPLFSPLFLQSTELDDHKQGHRRNGPLGSLKGEDDDIAGGTALYLRLPPRSAAWPSSP